MHPMMTNITNWWKGQGRFTVRCLLVKDTGAVYTLRDVMHGIDIDDFSDISEAKRFAFSMVHNLLSTPDTSYEIREMLRKHGKELAAKLNQGDLTTRQRETLGMMLEMIYDAEVGLK